MPKPPPMPPIEGIDHNESFGLVAAIFLVGVVTALAGFCLGYMAALADMGR